MCVVWEGNTGAEGKGINAGCLKSQTKRKLVTMFLSKSSYLSTCSFLLVELLA